MADWSINIQSVPWKINSFQDFKDWFDECPHQRTIAWWKIDALRERLESSDKFIKDPIVFLYDLYYTGDGTSLRNILSDPVVDNFYSVKWLRNLLVNSFGWELREKTTRTSFHVSQLEDRIQRKISEFETSVSDLLHWRPVPREFEMSQFLAKNRRMWKALYILKTLGWINKTMLLELSQKVWLSYSILAKALNKQIQDILEMNPQLNIEFEEVALRPHSIERWFQENKKDWDSNDE